MNRKNLLLFFLAFIFFTLFVIFTFIVKSHRLDHFDFNTTVRLENHVPRKFDFYFSIFSLLGSFEILTIFLVFLLILRKKISGIMILGAFMLGMGVEFFGKYLLNHPGPPFMFFRYDLGFLFPSSYIQPGSSYPSGHSFRTVFLCVVILYILVQAKSVTRSTKIVLAAMVTFATLLVLVSRVSLGEHWTTDVIGGTLLALCLSTLSIFFDNFLSRFKPVPFLHK